MNRLRSVLGMVTGTSPSMKDAVDNEKEMNPDASKPPETKTSPKEAKLDKASPSLEATEMTNEPQNDDDGSLSSLSFYEDFPTLYFAVRKGRYVNNSVFLSWDSARKHILDYPEAEYIATPTLEQAHQYTNNMGEFELDTLDENESTELETEAVESLQAKKPPPKAKPKPKPNDSPNPTMRSLVLEFYRLKLKRVKKQKGGIRKLLKRKKMLSEKHLFIKHWQRSGLEVLCNEQKPFQEAEAKYDRWIKSDEYDQWIKSDEKKKDAKASRKRKRKERNDKLDPSSVKNNEKKAAPNQSKKQKSIPNPATAIGTAVGTAIPNPATAISTAVGTAIPNSATAIGTTIGTAVGTSETKPEASATKEKSPSKRKSKKRVVSREEVWKEKYERLKAFRAKHGHTRIQVSDDIQLYGWVAYTRRRMYRSNEEKYRDGAPLDLWQIKLLNDIDFDIPYKKVFQQFEKFIGKRVAKLFDVETMHGIGTTVCKKVPFFGTVMCISDVNKKYLHVLYDDGDSEDYDLAWLKQGQELYKQYKDKDRYSTRKKRTSTKKGPNKIDETKGIASNDSKRATEGAVTNGKTTDPQTAAPKPATAKPVNDAIGFEDIEKKANEILGNKANNQESSITTTTNQERQNSDHNSNQNTNPNAAGNNDQLKNPSKNNENESDSSDEVEIVGVRVPYRPNPNLFVFPENTLSMSMINNTNDIINNDVMNAVVNQNIQNTIRNTMRANMQNNLGNDPYSIFREGFYDF